MEPVAVGHLDIGRVEKGKVSLVPLPYAVSKFMLQLLDEMGGTRCNLGLNLPFPWWLCQTLAKRGVAILLKGSNLAQPFGQMLVKYFIHCTALTCG